MTVRELIAELRKADPDEEVRMMSDPEGNDDRPLGEVAADAGANPAVTVLWPGYDPPKKRRGDQ